MKVLLIDDEPLARIGLRSVIPWEENGFVIAGEAANGVEGLWLAEECRPDLILVDLVMPEMDGLEFIRRVKRLLPDCKIIIMSCMDGVEYYREAIRCGVSEYIQKDRIDPDEILAAVKQAAATLRRERVFEENDEAGRIVNENVVLTEFLNLVLQGRIADPASIREKLAGKLELSGGRFAALALGLEGRSPAGEPPARPDYAALSLCQEIVTRACGGVLFPGFDGNLAGILTLPPQAETNPYLDRLFRQMAETAEQCVDCVLTGGASEEFSAPEGFGSAYREAAEALGRRFLGGAGRLYTGAELGDVSAGAEARSLLEGFLEADGLAALPEAAAKLEPLPHLLARGGLSAAQAKGMYADVLYHLRFLLRREGVEPELFFDGQNFPGGFLDQSDSAEELHRRVARLAREIADCGGRAGAKNARVVSELQAYVNRHLDERITLETLAGAVFLSPAYVCRLYKRETGENLQAYILRQKLERAKALLREHSVGETADRLGFRSHSYFIRVFKEQNGATPLQYQRRS